MVHNSESVKKKKYLLPIKTSKGIVIQSEELNDSENEDIENNTKNLLGIKICYLYSCLNSAKIFL